MLLFFFILSNFFLFSPYYRSSAIWPGDENLALIFFICSVYFYHSFFLEKGEKKKLIFVFLNISFLALASYFRPVYSLFSLYFFYEFILKKFNLKYLFFYTLISLILSFPAFYYIFIMKVTFFYDSVGSFNFINTFSLTYSVLLFYLIPFLIFFKKKFSLFRFNITHFLSSILITFFVIYLFNYDTSTGGGIFYMSQKMFFSGNFFFGIIFFVSFYLVNQLLEVKKTSNFILILILLFFELDNHFYMETFDPLFLICLFLLFKTELINSYMKTLNLKKICILFSYLLFFYTSKIISLYVI